MNCKKKIDLLRFIIKSLL